MSLCEQEAYSGGPVCQERGGEEAGQRRCIGELCCPALDVSQFVFRARMGDLGHKPGLLLLC